MGYDLWIEANIGAGGTRTEVDKEPRHITYNVDAMFALALGDEHAGVRNGADVVLHRKEPALERFVGRRCSDCYDELVRAVARMEVDPGAFLELEPANGWGSYDGALDYLRRLRDACLRHPHGYVAGWL